MAREVTDVVLNIFGLIAFSDRSKAPIEATLAYHHNVANPYTNLVNFATLSRDEADTLQAFFGALSPNIVALVPTATPAGKTVTDFCLEMVAEATYNDRTKASFSVRYVRGVLSYPDEAATIWGDMVSAFPDLLTSTLEKLAGAGNAALAEYVYRDCSDCEGEISTGDPGPLCGWTFDPIFGAGDSTVVFEPGGNITINSESETDYTLIRKPLENPPTTTFEKSGRYIFTEFPTDPNPTTTYQFWVNNVDLTETLIVSLFGDGNLIIQVGPVHDAISWHGFWTPNGGTHTLDFSSGTVDGKPKLYIDGEEIALSLLGVLFTFADSLPAGVVVISGGSGDPTPASSRQSLIITTGTLPAGALLGC